MTWFSLLFIFSWKLKRRTAEHCAKLTTKLSRHNKTELLLGPPVEADFSSVESSRSDRNHEEFDGNKKMTEINMSEKTKRKKRKNFWCLLCTVTTALLITDFQGKTKQTFSYSLCQISNEKVFIAKNGIRFFKWTFSHFHIMALTAATFWLIGSLDCNF
mgnify:FL=1